MAMPFAYIMSMAAFTLHWQDQAVVTMIVRPAKPKCLLFGPLHRESLWTQATK